MTGCPEPCKKENCEDVRKSTKLERRFGIVVDWEEVAESGLWDNVYVEDDEVCIATCYIDPLKAKCREKARYGGREVCSVLNCDHDERTRYAGCHTDHRREPYHRPTCKECGYLFPGCEGSSESDLADWDDTYWDAVRDSSAVPEDESTAARKDDSSNEEDDGSNDDDSSEETENDSESEKPTSEVVSDEQEDSKEEEKSNSEEDETRVSEETRDTSSDIYMPECAELTHVGETLKPDGSETGWTDKYDDVSECFRKCTAEGDAYRYVVEDKEAGNCYCWRNGYTWSSDGEGDRVYDVKSCSASKGSSDGASGSGDAMESSSDDDASTRRRKSEEQVNSNVSIDAGRQPSEKPSLNEDGEFIDYDYDYGEMELELDVEVPGTLGRDPFTNGNPILYASLQFLVPREDKAVESFKAERFRKQISAVAGVAVREVQLLKVESEFDRMCTNRNDSACVQTVSSPEEILTVSFVITPASATASAVQSQLETLASSGDLMRTLGDAGFKALEYSLDSAMVDSSGALVSESSASDQTTKGGSSAGIYAIAGVLVALAVALAVGAVVYMKRSRSNGTECRSAADKGATLPLSGKTGSQSGSSPRGGEQQSDATIGTAL